MYCARGMLTKLSSWPATGVVTAWRSLRVASWRRMRGTGRSKMNAIVQDWYGGPSEVPVRICRVSLHRGDCVTVRGRLSGG